MAIHLFTYTMLYTTLYNAVMVLYTRQILQCNNKYNKINMSFNMRYTQVNIIHKKTANGSTHW